MTVERRNRFASLDWLVSQPRGEAVRACAEKRRAAFSLHRILLICRRAGWRDGSGLFHWVSHANWYDSGTRVTPRNRATGGVVFLDFLGCFGQHTFDSRRAGPIQARNGHVPSSGHTPD
jgi:hypothetical protein